MSTFFKSSLSAVAIGALVFFSSCKEDPELPENIIAFQSAELGIAETETELDITLILSRAATETTQVTISIEEEGLLYNTDYTTTPAAVANVITIPVAAGSTEVSFTVTKTEIALFDGDESLEFTITNVPASLVIGANNQLELSLPK